MRRSRPTTHDAIVNAVRHSQPNAEKPEPLLPHDLEAKWDKAHGDLATQYASLEYLADETLRQAEILADSDGKVSVVVENDDSLVVHVESARNRIEGKKK